MSLTLFINMGASAEVVALPANSFATTGFSTPVYSGLKIDADGMLYERQPGGAWSAYGTWLLNGTNSAFYVSRTILEGTLTDDAGAGPLQLNTDRIYSITGNNKTTLVRFDISDDFGGTPIIASRTYRFTSYYETFL